MTSPTDLARHLKGRTIILRAVTYFTHTLFNLEPVIKIPPYGLHCCFSLNYIIVSGPWCLHKLKDLTDERALESGRGFFQLKDLIDERAL